MYTYTFVALIARNPIALVVLCKQETRSESCQATDKNDDIVTYLVDFSGFFA